MHITMNINTLSPVASVAASNAPACAQTTAARTTPSNDPIVQMRPARHAADTICATGLIENCKAPDAKGSAAVDAKGKDPLVAKRDTAANANKATWTKDDANLNTLAADRGAALNAAAKSDTSENMNICRPSPAIQRQAAA